jgi:nitroreductase
MTAKPTAKSAKPKASAKSKSAAKPKAAAAGESKAAAKSVAPKAKSAAKAAPKTKAAAKKTVAAKSPKAAAAVMSAAAKQTAAKQSAAKKTAAKQAAAAKPATKKAAAKPAAAKPEPRKPAKSTVSKKPTKAAARAAAEPIEAVRPLNRVRQAREFTTRKVTRAELEAITEVARWSGSSRNEQPCRFIAMRDQELIGRIADMALPQTRGLRSATAAVAIVEPDEPERADSRTFDDGRAAERMLIAAHMLGLGGGISRVRADVRDGINKALRLPSNRSVRTIVALGHPTEDALQPQSPPGKARLPREEVIYEECWPDPPLKD